MRLLDRLLGIDDDGEPHSPYAEAVWMTTKEAAGALQVTPRRITQWLKAGKLRGRLIGKRGKTYSEHFGGVPSRFKSGSGIPGECRGGSVWRIDPASVETLIFERRMEDLERSERAIVRAQRQRVFFTRMKKMGRPKKREYKSAAQWSNH